MPQPEHAPRVSVVMPVYNGGAFLTEAIESLLRQSMSDLEIVAVDDGSDDGSAAVLEGFQRRDRRVRLIATDHRGVVVALNRGCAEARAEYVAVAHADDLSLPERLARQVAYMDENPRTAVVGCFLQTIDDAGTPGHVLRFPVKPEGIRLTLPRRNCLAHPSVVFRRTVIEAVGGYRFDYVEDYDLWLRVSERFDLANLPETLVRYRLHRGQISLSRVEEMERAGLAVRAAARVRASRQQDPLEGVHEITPAILERLGISNREVARVVRSELLSRAAILAELDAASAQRLLHETSEMTAKRAAHSLAAARELLRADSCLAAGRQVSAMAHLTRAFGHEPFYASSRLTTWTGERLRAVFATRWRHVT